MDRKVTLHKQLRDYEFFEQTIESDSLSIKEITKELLKDFDLARRLDSSYEKSRPDKVVNEETGRSERVPF